MKKIKIQNKFIGENEPVFIIAEISANHLQKKENALKLIEEAKKAGADAVKFQTYTPDTMTLDVDNEYFRIKGTIWEGRTLYELYKEAYTPWEWTKDLKQKAEELGLIFFSTPFDLTAVDHLEENNVPVYKIASFEIHDIPLLKYVASKKKPIILSTGVATLEDIEFALQTIKAQGNEDIILLKCTSAYPAPYDELNLKTIPDLEKRFGVISGLSDHTLGLSVPVASVALGARVIEKHFTLDRKLEGPDAKFSLEPTEFKEMVEAVRQTEKALGKVSYELGEKAKEHLFSSRSIFVAKDIEQGEIFTKENIRIVRPGFGLRPKHYGRVLGKKAKKALKKGTPLDLEMVE